jgi:hypothetical protein
MHAFLTSQHFYKYPFGFQFFLHLSPFQHFVEENQELKLFVSGPFELDGNVIGVGITVLKLDILNYI